MTMSEYESRRAVEALGEYLQTRRALRWGAAALLALTVLVYWPVLSFGFVYEDANWLRGIAGAVHPSFRPSRRIIPEWSWWLDLQLYGLDPTGWHVTNLLLHLTNGILVCWLTFRISRRAVIALTALSFFLLHPLNIETVAYVTERSELLSAMGVLLALLCLTDPFRISPLLLVSGLTCGLLGMAAKESGVVVLPLLLLIYGQSDWLLDRYEFYGMTAVMGAWLGVMALGLPLVYDLNWQAAYTWTEWLRLQSTAGLGLLFTWVLPLDLTIDHHWEAVPRATQWLSLACWLLLPAWALTWLLMQGPRWRLVVIGLVWYWLAVLPRLVVQVPRSLLNEHQAYVASVGLALATAGLIFGRREDGSD